MVSRNTRWSAFWTTRCSEGTQIPHMLARVWHQIRWMETHKRHQRHQDTCNCLPSEEPWDTSTHISPWLGQTPSNPSPTSQISWTWFPQVGIHNDAHQDSMPLSGGGMSGFKPSQGISAKVVSSEVISSVQAYMIHPNLSPIILLVSNSPHGCLSMPSTVDIPQLDLWTVCVFVHILSAHHIQNKAEHVCAPGGFPCSYFIIYSMSFTWKPIKSQWIAARKSIFHDFSCKTHWIN